MANTKIPSELIADSSITAAKLADGTITTADIADSNVTTAKIADSNVTTAKIGDAQVTTAKITDANVTTGKIADDAVTTAKMASNSVTSDTIASGITLAGTTSTGALGVTGNIAVSGTVDGIDIAARDAVLTSTTTTAGAALPKAGGTMTGNLAINNGSPELHFGTTGNHYNWRLAAQETIDAAFEIGVGSQDTDYSNDTYVPKLVILSGGKVGIGTNNPTNKFGVKQTSINTNERMINLYTGSTTANAYVSIGAQYSETNALSNSEIRFGNEVQSNAPSFLAFATGNTTAPTERMRIDSSGNVGIGATSGEANLVVRDVSDGTHKGGRIGFGIHEAGALQMFHATNMSRTAGTTVTDSTSSGGDNVTLSSGQLYGPYHTLPRGQYRLCVKMKTTNAAYTGEAARLTCHVSSGTVIPETRTVRGVDFGTNNKWQTFSVPFQVVGAATNAVEFYLFALNNQSISVDYFFIMNDTDSYSTKVYGDQIVDGNVGIGTSAPTELLHIKNPSNSWNEYARIRIGTETSDSYASEIGFHRGTSSDADRGFFIDGGGAGTQHFKVLHTGNVGIGTTAPAYKLDISGTSNDLTPLIRGTASNTPSGGFNWATEFIAPNLANDKRLTHIWGKSRTTYGMAHVSYMPKSTASESYLALGLWGANDKLNVLGNGNVGIGNTSPQVPLALGNASGERMHVYHGGNVRAGFGVDMSGSSRELSMFHSTTGTNGLISFGRRLESNGAYTETARIDGSGDIYSTGQVKQGNSDGTPRFLNIPYASAASGFTFDWQKLANHTNENDQDPEKNAFMFEVNVTSYLGKYIKAIIVVDTNSTNSLSLTTLHNSGITMTASIPTGTELITLTFSGLWGNAVKFMGRITTF